MKGKYMYLMYNITIVMIFPFPCLHAPSCAKGKKDVLELIHTYVIHQYLYSFHEVWVFRIDQVEI